MRFFRFLLAAILSSLTTFFFARWARAESEKQIDSMQLSAYNSPGAEMPVPPHVFAAGMSALTALWFVQGPILRMPLWQRILAVLIGAVAGVSTLFVLSTDEG